MCQFSYQPLSIFIKNIPNYTHTLFLTISSHILVSKPLYYSFAHRFYSFYHFIRQPFAILSLTCISFHISHHSHAIISCPHPFLPIITITFSSHNNSTKTVFCHAAYHSSQPSFISFGHLIIYLHSFTLFGLSPNIRPRNDCLYWSWTVFSRVVKVGIWNLNWSHKPSVQPVCWSFISAVSTRERRDTDIHKRSSAAARVCGLTNDGFE